MKRKALGRGLDALLPKKPSDASFLHLDLDEVRPNPLQPRVSFQPEKLDELALSLKEKGVLQPIVVRPSEHGGYEIIAGERRWRAAQRAGLDRIPAIVQDRSDGEVLELALVENIQRDDLSPIEEANAYQLMASRFNLTQEQIASRVGKSRVAVTNTLRLLQLPGPIQEMVSEGQLSMGHARALIPLHRDQQMVLAKQIVEYDLSVRETERRAAKVLKGTDSQRKKKKDPNLEAAERRLEDLWQTRVEIRLRGKAGQVVLHFHSSEELDRLYENLLKGS